MLIWTLTLLLLEAAAPVYTPAPAPAPVVAAAEESRRVIGLAGAPNFRDLGGYATADGRHVRWGVIYRSNKLSELTPDDLARVDRLGIRTEVDLRTLDERQREPSRWTHPPRDLYESPKPALDQVTRTIFTTNRADPRAGFIAFYAQMPDLYREEYAALFHRLAAQDTPLVVHCTAGKDRTGVASALLLEALRVPRATVVGDYALTSQLLHRPPVAAQGAAGSSDMRALMSADPVYITAALEAVDREYGSIDTYMKRALGMNDVEIASLRRSLTE